MREPIGVLRQAGALGFEIVELGGDAPPRQTGGAMVRIGVHRGGVRPLAADDACDILLASDPSAPQPWVGLDPKDLGDALLQLKSAIERQPVASTVVAQLCRMTLALSFDDALAAESMAYSMLLGSEDFRAWRARTPIRRREADAGPRVSVTRDEAGLRIRLTRPHARNAFDCRMRDELVEALEFAVADPDAAAVIVSGEGPTFCAGGDLDEFGQAEDPGRAHAVRVFRSATRLMSRLGPRVTVRLHGACVGAGVEIPAAAHRVFAEARTTFRLPEVSMGLVPGAGGTASIPRRIGRQRACYLAISGATLDVRTALAWGLIDEIAP